MALTAWNDLLGLPLQQAEAKVRAQGVEPRVVVTSAPRRQEVQEGTLRVIRVRGTETDVELTVSAFMDGDPRQA